MADSHVPDHAGDPDETTSDTRDPPASRHAVRNAEPDGSDSDAGVEAEVDAVDASAPADVADAVVAPIRLVTGQQVVAPAAGSSCESDQQPDDPPPGRDLEGC